MNYSIYVYNTNHYKDLKSANINNALYHITTIESDHSFHPNISPFADIREIIDNTSKLLTGDCPLKIVTMIE